MLTLPCNKTLKKPTKRKNKQNQGKVIGKTGILIWDYKPWVRQHKFYKFCTFLYLKILQITVEILIKVSTWAGFEHSISFSIGTWKLVRCISFIFYWCFTGTFIFSKMFVFFGKIVWEDILCINNNKYLLMFTFRHLSQHFSWIFILLV